MSDIRTFQRLLDAEGKSKTTIRAYTQSATYFLMFCNENGYKPQHTTKKTMLEFMAWLRERGMTHNSVARHIFAVKKFLDLVYDIRVDVEPPSGYRQLPHYLSRDEVRKIIEAASEDLKHETLLALTYECALRAAEVAKLNVEDIDTVNWLLRVRGKGSRERFVPIKSKHVRDLLLTYIDAYNIDKGALFRGKNPSRRISVSGVHKIFYWAVEKAGVKIPEGVGIHILRHSRAVHLLMDGVDIRYIRDFLGHQRLETTAIYTAITKTDLKARIDNTTDLWQ